MTFENESKNDEIIERAEVDQNIVGDSGFVRSTKDAWKDVEVAKGRNYSMKEYLEVLKKEISKG